MGEADHVELKHTQRMIDLFYIQTEYYPEMYFSKRENKAGYSPKCANRFDEKCKANNYHCDDCQHRQLNKLTEQVIAAHLAGKQTIGAYQVYNDLVKWFCLDFDIANDAARSGALELATTLKATLEHLSISAYLEDSGNKGYHLWVFFNPPIKAELAQRFGQQLLASVENEYIGVEVEVFPKQTKVTENDFGNLVKLPLGIHKKTGNRCNFIDSSGQAISDQLDYLLNIETTTPADVANILNELSPTKSEKKSESDKQLPDILPEGKRDKMLTSLAGTMRARGMTPDEIETALLTINQNRCKPPLDDKSIAKIAKSVGRYEPKSEIDEETQAHYALIDNNIIFKKPKPIHVRGTIEPVGYEWQDITVCNFSIGIASELRSCDGDETENMFSICGQTSDRPFKFDIPAEDLADQRKLQAALLVHAGGRGIVYAGQMKHILPALQSLSNGYEREIRYVSTGWQRVGDDWIFVTPGGAVGVDLVRCDVAAELRNYRVLVSDTELADGIKALEYLLESFEHPITYPAVAHAFLAPLLRYLPNVKRYCLHLTGETGSLKTTFATVLLCLFGDFGNEDPTAKFGSTINSIEGLGHQAKDVLFVVDDFKPRYVKLEDITRLVQGYSDGHGRGRMNRDASLKATKYVRGSLLTTGEDVPEHEASIIARSLILKMSRWDGKNENLAKAQALSRALPCVMGSFIDYLMGNDMTDVEQLITRKRDEFLTALSGQAVTNAGRIATNAAQNWLAFRYLCGWLENIDEWSGFVAEKALREHEEILLALCSDMAKRISEEKASTVFVEGIQALVESGQMVLIPRLNDETVPLGKEFLGWQDNEGIYMQANIAFHAVERWLRQIGKSIGFNAGAVWDQLEADGLLLERNRNVRVGEGGLKQKKIFHFSPKLLDIEGAIDDLNF